MDAKDKQRLYDAYAATSTETKVGNDQLESYQEWLERQLLSRMDKVDLMEDYFKCSDCGKMNIIYQSKLSVPSDVIEELTDIRKELMIVEFGGDWPAMKFQVNRLDTLLYKFHLEQQPSKLSVPSEEAELKYLRQYKKDTEEILNDPRKLGEYMAGM